MANKITVKRTGRTWGVYRGETLIEGGFFARDAAEACAMDWRDYYARAAA